MSAIHKAIALFVGQIVLFFGETIVINHIGTAASVMQLALIRNLGGLTLAWLLGGGLGVNIFRTKILRLQIVRASLSVVTMWTLIYSFSHLSLTDATAVSYTQAVFLTVFSLFVLDERVPVLRWLALLFGILGTLIVIRPAFEVMHWAYLVALLGVGLNALILVVTKPMERKDTAVTVMAYVSTVGIICNLPGLYFGGLPDLHLWPWLLLMSVLGPSGMYLAILAIRAADISILAPWVYLRLILAGCFSDLALAQAPDPLTLVGATIIFLSCGLTFPTSSRIATALRGGRLGWHRERWSRAARAAAPEADPPPSRTVASDLVSSKFIAGA